MIRGAFDQGINPTISLVNKATVPLGVELDKLAAALQHFTSEIFSPIWGVDAKLVVSHDIIVNTWAIVFLDTADAANALGYHELTKSGQPISKVFVKTTLAAKESVSVTACHELAEMLVDPGIQMWADRGNGTLYAYEMCDAVEETTFLIDGIEMSNFVHPAFFESFRKAGSVQFDHLKHVTAPFQTLKGGYQITMREGRIGQVFGSAEKEQRFAREDRRLHRSEYRRQA